MGASRQAAVSAAYGASGGVKASKGASRKVELTKNIDRPGKASTTHIVSGQRAATPSKLQRAASAPALRRLTMAGDEHEPPPSPKLTPRELEESVSRLSRPRYPDKVPESPKSTPRGSAGASRPSTPVEKVGFGVHAASNQKLAMQRSAPSFSFGASTRTDANKVFISQGHTLTVMYGKLSPGPTRYTLPSAVGGRQPDGKRPNPPNWAFGSGPRFLSCGKLDRKPGCVHRLYSYTGEPVADGAIASAPAFSFGASTRDQMKNVYVSEAHTMTIRAGTQSPGPVYSLPSAVGGRQGSGRIRNQPSYHIGGRDRAVDSAGLDTPGPIYNLPGPLGKQPSAAHRSESAYSFASNARPPVDAGLSSPGPIYNLPSAICKQPRAGKRSAPNVAFTQRSRWADLEREQKNNSVPGPGHYG